MSRKIATAVSIMLLLAMGACQTSREITRRSELEDPVRIGSITVYTQDRGRYELAAYVLGDSAIQGSGTLHHDGTLTSFYGEIPLSSIVAIRARSRSVMKGLLTAGAVGMFAVVVADAADVESGLVGRQRIEYHGPSGGGGSSCPFVYAWNGERFVFQAEPFGIGLGKALELTTYHLLPSAREEDGIVPIRLSNERLETHFANSIRLLAIDPGTWREIALDGEGAAWPLADPRPPQNAIDDSGRSILSRISTIDGQMWECDAASLTRDSRYEDMLELAFAVPPGARHGTMVLTGINTELSTAIFAYLCRIAGDQAPVLVQAFETDPEMIALLEDCIEDASLKVHVWNGSEWERAGRIEPEANAAPFSRALRIHIPDGASETVRLRLTSMADVWRIDAIRADWADAVPLTATELPLLSAVGQDGEEFGHLLCADDDRYAILLPPDRVDLRFQAPEDATTRAYIYAVAGRGYLHEWLSNSRPEGLGTLAEAIPGERRIDFLKEVLRHRDLALQPVYEEWAKRRAR